MASTTPSRDSDASTFETQATVDAPRPLQLSACLTAPVAADPSTTVFVATVLVSGDLVPLDA